jgi:type II secretory pathway component PulM
MDPLNEQSPQDSRPRTTSVLVLLLGAALIFSYLVSYALTNALVAANLMQHWTPGHDPRPRRMLLGFASLMLSFLAFGAIARWLSKRQLARIDQMEEEEESRGEGQGARSE